MCRCVFVKLTSGSGHTEDYSRSSVHLAQRSPSESTAQSHTLHLRCAEHTLITSTFILCQSNILSCCCHGNAFNISLCVTCSYGYLHFQGSVSTEGLIDTREKGEEPKVLTRSSSSSDQSEHPLMRKKSMHWTRRLSRRSVKRSDSSLSFMQQRKGVSRRSEREELTELVRNRMQHLGLHTAGYSKL